MAGDGSDIMGKNHHRKRTRALYAWAWVLGLLATSSLATPMPATLTLGPLALAYSAAWVRAEAGEEDADDSFILRIAGDEAPLTVYVPRRAVPLKTGPDRFFSQLESAWRARHGRSAAISRVRLGGYEWALCVRPSMERDARVFHFVTVHQGHAYHLLAVREGSGMDMPDPVRDILVSVRPTGRLVAETSSSARDGPQPDVPLTGVAPAQPIQSGDEPGSSPAAQPWALARQRVVVPRGASLAQAAQGESERIGDAGMLMGYGLSELDDGVAWFMDGFFLDPEKSGKAARLPFALDWRYRWQLPEGGAYPDRARLVTSIEGHVSMAGTEASPGLAVEAWPLCGPRSGVLDILARPAESAREMELWLAGAHACREGARPHPLAGWSRAATGDAEAGKRQDHDLPLAWPKPDEAMTAWLLILRPRPAGHDGAMGQNLLEEVAVYAMYVIGSSPEATARDAGNPGS